MNNTDIDDFNYEKEYINKYNFATKISNDLKFSLIKSAEKLINRENTKKILLKYLEEQFIIEQVEKGIFEFSLITTMINKLQNHFVEEVYNDKLYDLCVNLDLKNERVNNKTLLPAVLKGEINPYFLAFMRPEQLHPKRWSDILNRNIVKEETVNNLSTTDLYTCRKCGEKKCRVSELQTRCADEPSTKFITCLVCHNTFIK
jgi:DNA-directed RNA polymerase subunit M/transcription elongation factor TFIIS